MRRAFTLIEILAALALASVLMVVLLTVTTRANRSLAQLMQHDAAPVDDDGLIAMLRHDLTHAQSVTTADDDIVIVGFGGLDRASFEPTHRPVRVTYRLLHGPDAVAPSRLIREQVELDNLTNRESSIELVAIGLEAISVRGVGSAAPSVVAATGSAPTLPPLALRFEVVCRWVGSEENTTHVIDRG